MTTRVTYEAKSGAPCTGEADGNPKSPAVVLIQEWWGLNDHIRDIMGRLAKEGFFVVAPDLYHGKTTKDPQEAAKLMGDLDTLKAVDEIAGAVAYAKAHGNGNVGVMGFCLGGALTLAAACHIEGISAAVPFYGIPPAEKVDYTKVTAPVLAHVAKRDEWVTVPKAEEVQKKIGDKMTLHVYDADHAFVNDTRPQVYDAANAKLAWDRSIAFLRKHLA
jgi:carboxymethylenebutenolidase